MNLTVFTTTLGDTDQLQAPLVMANRVRYICFTDVLPRQPLPPYEFVRVALDDEDSTFVSRRLKILANHPALRHPDVVVWHDAAFQLRCDPRALVYQELVDIDFLAFAHPHRTRIDQEAPVIADLGYMPRDRVMAQLAAYEAEGFVGQQTAITSTGFSIRRMTPAMRAFNAAWWAEVERWGWRDQMSVDYARWKCGMPVRYIAGHYRDNPYARWRKYSPNPLVRPHRCHTDERSAAGVSVV